MKEMEEVWAIDGDYSDGTRLRAWRDTEGRFGFQLVEYRNPDGTSIWNGDLKVSPRRFVYDFGAGRWVEYYRGSTFSRSQSKVVKDTEALIKWLLSGVAPSRSD